MLSEVKNRLRQAGIENPDLEARWILKNVLKVSDAELIAGPEKPITHEIEKILERRAEGEPLSRILGERQFWGLDFIINEHVLDPRPDTEIIVETALKLFHVKHPVSILDLGTGSGCILISLLYEFTESKGMGVDVSEKALAVAKQNVARNGVEQRAELIKDDWSEHYLHNANSEREVPSYVIKGERGAGALSGRRFDLVISNPPYIPTGDIPGLEESVRNHDPILALDGGSDGLQAYKKIFSLLPGILNPGGKALLEIGFDQKEAIERLGKESRIRIEGFHNDYGGHARVVEITCGDK